MPVLEALAPAADSAAAPKRARPLKAGQERLSTAVPAPLETLDTALLARKALSDRAIEMDPWLAELRASGKERTGLAARAIVCLAVFGPPRCKQPFRFSLSGR
jgi:hypothetical protein